MADYIEARTDYRESVTEFYCETCDDCVELNDAGTASNFCASCAAVCEDGENDNGGDDANAFVSIEDYLECQEVEDTDYFTGPTCIDGEKVSFILCPTRFALTNTHNPIPNPTPRSQSESFPTKTATTRSPARHSILQLARCSIRITSRSSGRTTCACPAWRVLCTLRRCPVWDLTSQLTPGATRRITTMRIPSTSCARTCSQCPGGASPTWQTSS